MIYPDISVKTKIFNDNIWQLLFIQKHSYLTLILYMEHTLIFGTISMTTLKQKSIFSKN